MSLRSQPIAPVPPDTVRVARAAFPKGTPYLTLRDALGAIFQDHAFADLYSREGQPGLAPWQLALVTGEGVERLLDTLLRRCRELGLLKARGQQRTDAPHVFAAIRVLNRLELLGETLRATLNDLATAAPDWLQRIAPLAWYERYGKRIEDTRLPKEEGEREAYAQQVGTDGFALLDALAAPETAAALGERASVRTLRQLWSQHFEGMRTLGLHRVLRMPPRALGEGAGAVRASRPPLEGAWATLAAFPVQSIALGTSLMVARDLSPLTAIMVGNTLAHKTRAVRMVDALCGVGSGFLLRIE